MNQSMNSKTKMEEDEVEHAIFELQDVKNAYVEQREQEIMKVRQSQNFKTQDGFFSSNQVATTEFAN